MRRLAIVAVIATGCHKKGDIASCYSEAAGTSAAIEMSLREPALPLGDIALVQRNATRESLDPAWPLVTVHGTIQLGGAEVSVDALGDAMREHVSGPAYVLAIDAAEPWSRVTAVVEAAWRATFTQPHLVFDRPLDPTERPRPSMIDPALDAVTGPHRTADLLLFLQRAAVHCPSLQVTLAEVERPDATGSGSAHRADHLDVLASRLMGSLLDCRCDVDMDELRAILFRLYDHPHLATLALAIGPLGTPIAHPADMPWRDAAPSLVDSREPVYLRVVP